MTSSKSKISLLIAAPFMAVAQDWMDTMFQKKLDQSDIPNFLKRTSLPQSEARRQTLLGHLLTADHYSSYHPAHSMDSRASICVLQSICISERSRHHCVPGDAREKTNRFVGCIGSTLIDGVS